MSVYRSSRPALLLVVLALVVGCAGDGRHRRADAPVRDLPPGYDMSSLQRAAYGTREHAESAQSALVTLMEEQLPRPEGAVIEHDPALDEVAAVVATTLAETEQMPASSLVRWLFWQAGVTAEMAGTYGSWGSAWAAPAALDEDLAQHARRLTEPPRGVRRFGVARVQVGSFVGQALVVGDAVVDLDALTKTTSAGADVTVSGRFHVPAKGIRAFVSDGPTAIRKLPVEVNDDGTFAVTFAAPATAGEHYVELAGYLGEDVDRPASQRWHRQATMFPLFVDTPLPTQPHENIRQPPPNPDDVGAFAAAVLARYNAARAEVNVPPLKLDPRLVALAERNVADTSRQHRWHDDGQRLAAKGLPVRRAHQIASQFEYLEEDLWELLRSPAMRATLLDEKLSHVGLAYARDEQGRGFRGRTLLVRPVGKLDAEVERKALLARLNRFLDKDGRAAAKADDKLTALAQGYAEQVCAGELDIEDLTALQRDVERASRGRFRSYGVWRVVGPYIDPTDRRNYKDVLSRPFTTTGVGVCQGRVNDEANVELVVFLTAGQ